MSKERRYARRNQILAASLALYIFAAALWWAVLLYRKTQETHAQVLENIRLTQKIAGDHDGSMEAVRQTSAFADAEKQWQRQIIMIVSEGGVLTFSLLIGVWFLAASYRREVLAAQTQRNFLLSITHELKSPLASIKLVVQTFMKRPELPSIKVLQLANAANTEADRLQELVENLLLAAKLEAEYKPVFEPLDVKEIVDSIFEQLTLKYPLVSWDLVSQGDTFIEADKKGITSLLLNLIENAAKYSGSNKPVSVRLIQKPKFLLIEVADNGNGIKASDKAYVFDRFYRAGDENTRTSKGTGLGLYIVQQVINTHSGRVLIKDNLPKGTIFEVTLPIKQRLLKNE